MPLQRIVSSMMFVNSPDASHLSVKSTEDVTMQLSRVMVVNCPDACHSSLVGVRRTGTENGSRRGLGR